MDTIKEPTITTARKDYACEECCKPILKGSKYMDSVYTDGMIWHWRQHIDCNGLVRNCPSQFEPYYPEERDVLKELWNGYRGEIKAIAHGMTFASQKDEQWAKKMIEKFQERTNEDR